jgi:hypothetical protein
MGKNIVHCGGSGAGGITKLCNNLSLAISMIGTCEAMALVSLLLLLSYSLLFVVCSADVYVFSALQGVRLGMDPHTLAGVMNTSTARYDLWW